jgi:hypothetical protein
MKVFNIIRINKKESFPPYQLIKLFLWQMNHFFNINDVSGFLENLTEIEKIKSISNISKENDKKTNAEEPKRYVTVNDLMYSFFEQSRRDRNLLSDELDFIYCCLSIMLGFSLKSKMMVRKKLDLLANILKKKEEKTDPNNAKMNEVISHMRDKLKYFEALSIILFKPESNEDTFPFNESENLSQSQLNLLALHNIQKGNLNKSQLLFKRALLRAKLQNRSMSRREYVDDIYNTNTETKISHQMLLGEGSQKDDPFTRKTHQSEEYLLFNSALLLIKRGKFSEAVEVFQNIKNCFQQNPQFWYRYGQASKGIFLKDVEQISKLYDYYFQHKKKKFYAHDRKNEKPKMNGSENDLDEFISFYSQLIDTHKKNIKSEFKKQTNAYLKDILNRRKLVTMFKAKNLLSLTNRLYLQTSKYVVMWLDD